MKSVTVVGADGFIGSAMVKGLCQNGYAPVRITRSSTIKNYNTNIMFYVAGSTTPYNAADGSAHIEFDLYNLTQTLNALKKIKKRPLFVFTSSAGTVYDPSGPQPYRESSLLKPTNLYGRAKLDQETVVRKSDWVDSLILRLSNVYGPYQDPKPGFGVIAHWAQKVCSHEPIEMMGNSYRDYLNIFDLIDISLEIMNRPQSHFAGTTVNVGSGKIVSLYELYEIFVETAGQPIKMIKRSPRSFDTEAVSIDISLAKKLFDWQPKIPLDMGIKGVLDAKLKINHSNHKNVYNQA